MEGERDALRALMHAASPHLDADTWVRLAGRPAPAQLDPVGQDFGQFAALHRARWSDGHTAVLKISADRRRGERELDFLRSVPGDDWPRLLGGVEEPDRVLVLLEDLGHATPGDILRGVRAPEAVAAVGVLARLHKAPPPSHWSRGPTRWRGATADDVEAFLHRYPSDQARRVLLHLPDAVTAHRELLDAAPLAVVHRDAHLDNWMFRPDPVLIDFETAAIGPCIVDVARFLMEGVGTSVRRRILTDLLQAWADELGLPGGAPIADWLRAAVWYTLDAMLPYHATVDLDGKSPRMQAVHRRTVAQSLALADDLGLGSPDRR